MSTHGFTRASLAVSAIAITMTAAPLTAQSVWVEPGRHQGVWMEVLRPELSQDLRDLLDVSFISSATFFGGRYAVSPRLNVVGELPFAYGDLKEIDIDGHRATIGNPYLAIEYAASRPLVFELGVRAPLADEESFGTLIGLLTEFPTRSEAFLTDYVPVTASASYDFRLDDRLMFRLRGGPSLWLNTGDTVDPETDETIVLDTELLATYGGQLWYDAPRYNLGAGLIGRAALTADGDFGQRTLHQLGFSGNLVLGKVVPGLQFRVPLDDDDGVDFVAGLNLGLRIN